MTTLEVPGARLYYETHGSGPLLIMIAGASGTADSFRMAAGHLAAHYTVAIYDRRGFSRSRLDGPQDYDRRLETDADDVRRLIEHLADEPAIVFGVSSGAIVALEVLARHPTVVRTLVPYEPPAVRQLPDGQQWVDFFFSVYDLYQRSGIEPAMAKFRDHAFAQTDRQAMAHAPKNVANSTYWFEHELRQYPPVDLDIDTLTAHADRIALTAGRESRGYPCHGVNIILGKQFGREVIELPGGHIGFITHSAEFATELIETLAPTRHKGER
jgi:pimeloyl-ACP methyl ester carboxylesterase